MMSEIFNPKQERFKEPKIGSMEEYFSLVADFEEDYEGTWAQCVNDKID